MFASQVSYYQLDIISILIKKGAFVETSLRNRNKFNLMVSLSLYGNLARTPLLCKYLLTLTPTRCSCVSDVKKKKTCKRIPAVQVHALP